MADRDDHTGSGHQRRRLLQAGLGAAALGAVPGAGQLAAHAQGTFDWKRFKGEKLEVFLVKSPRGDLLTKYHKEFEDMTGISRRLRDDPRAAAAAKGGHRVQFRQHELRRDRAVVSRAKAPVRQEQMDGRRPPADGRQVADRPQPRLRRFLQGRRRLGDAAGRPHRQPAVQHRSVGDLLQQGAVRREESRLPEELRRARRCGGEAQ